MNETEIDEAAWDVAWDVDTQQDVIQIETDLPYPVFLTRKDLEEMLAQL